ncbi:MAG: hypothetical protein ACT4OX_15665 [Actinomycetota bacterium]
MTRTLRRDEALALFAKCTRRAVRIVERVNTATRRFSAGRSLSARDSARPYLRAANRLAAVYGDLISETRALRATSIPPELEGARNALATLVDQPLDEIEACVRRAEELAEEIIAWERSGYADQPPLIELRLVLSVDHGLVAEFQRGLRMASSQ